MSKRLLTEYFALCDGGVCPDFLTESEKRNMAEGRAFYMTGKIQEADVQNGNGRVYPKNVLMREMKNYQKLIDGRRAVGELDHPDTSVVELKNASHLITEVWWDGNNVMGKLEVLNTPAGKTLKAHPYILKNSGSWFPVPHWALLASLQFSVRSLLQHLTQL